MKNSVKNFISQRILFISIIALVLFAVQTVSAQTTEFTYQSRLTDSSMAATGNYDFTFGLFGSESGGGAITTLTRANVPVSNGVFTVKLDYGSTFLSG